MNILNYTIENVIITDFLNLPNPFKQSTHFTFQVPEPSNLPISIEVNIFDLDGNLLKTLTHKNINQTFNSITWDGSNSANQDLPNGTYIAYIVAREANGQKQSKKHIITKIK